MLPVSENDFLPVRTIEQCGEYFFPLVTHSNSIGIGVAVPVVGLCVNAHQHMKITFVQMLKGGIKERSVSHCRTAI